MQKCTNKRVFAHKIARVNLYMAREVLALISSGSRLPVLSDGTGPRAGVPPTPAPFQISPDSRSF